MIEIPKLRVEKNQKQFTQELKRALENVGVAQINGLEQGLVDELYQGADDFTKQVTEKRSKKNCPLNLENGYSIDQFYFNDDGSYILGTLPLVMEETPEFNKLVRKIHHNLSHIANRIRAPINDICHKKIYNPNGLLLKKYKKNQEDNPKKEEELLLKEHGDIFSILLPTASREGLEGFVNKEWIPLEPQLGHVLFLPGRDIGWNTLSPKIKELKHRVRVHGSYNTPRYALAYY